MTDELNLDYSELIKQLNLENPPITLGPEYAHFIKDNLLRFLIRLARYKFVYKMLKKNDEVLEIGCGSGLGTIFLAQKCKTITGIDLRENEINDAKKINRRDNIEFINGNFYELSENKKFDVIVALDVIEHMNEEDGEKLISATRKYLKEEGVLIIGTPSIYSYPFQGELSKADHIKCYDLEELETVIERYFGRTMSFSMNDEMVHTGFHKMAWYYFVFGVFKKKLN